MDALACPSIRCTAFMLAPARGSEDGFATLSSDLWRSKLAIVGWRNRRPRTTRTIREAN